MPVDREAVDRLLRGTLRPSAAAAALIEILSPYTLRERREIVNRVKDFIEESRAVPAFVAPSQVEDDRATDALISRLWDLSRGDSPTISEAEVRDRAPALDEVSDVIRLELTAGSREIPLFQFDRARLQLGRLEVRPPIQRVNRSLLAERDPWGALSWWVTPNGYLRGRAPAALDPRRSSKVLEELAEAVAS